LLFFAQVDESDGSATVWGTSLKGELTSTVRFADGVVERIPNDELKADFATEKFIFLTKMRMQPAGQEHTSDRPNRSGFRRSSQASPTHKEQQRPAVLGSETLVFLLNPWTFPVIVMILALGVHRAAATR